MSGDSGGYLKVAEYEGIIKVQAPKIAQTELRLAALQREREQLTGELQRERGRLTGELKSIEHQLSLAREEKNKIENQIQFMAYRYSLPDGSPAVTREQVKTAQNMELRHSFLSSLSMSCTLGLGNRVFRSYSYEKADAKNPFWPFSEQEINTLKEHGSKYPLNRAIECINSFSTQFSQRYGQNSTSSSDIESLRKDAVQYANGASAKSWISPVQPADILEELATKRSAIQSELTGELKKVEEQYGGWESAFGQDRRAIFKNNYQVGKQNAEMKAISDRFSLEYQMQEKANVLRKSIYEEVKRLIISESKREQNKGAAH